jgi:hypothetical protein
MWITFQDISINDELAIQWNGSATFNVLRQEQMEGEWIALDCFTVYGKDTQGGACTFEEAKQHAEDYLRNPDGDEEGWMCNHCQVVHTSDMTVGHEDEDGKTCELCWDDVKSNEAHVCTLCHVPEGDGSCCGCLDIQRDQGRYEGLWDDVKS